MKAQEYFRDEVFAVYKYLLHLKLAGRSVEEIGREIDSYEGRLPPQTVERIVRDREARRKAIARANRHVHKLLAGYSADDALSQIFAFITPETSRTPRSAKFARRIKEVFEGVKNTPFD